MTITRELCDIIAATNYDSLGEECVRRVKQAIADGVAVAAAGSLEEPVKMLAAHVKSLGGKPQATLWGYGFKTSPVQAAYVNGVATHVLDFEPKRLSHALGLAASRAGALLANIGSMTKSTHCGYAGASGLDAALLAARGFTANSAIFEAPRVRK